MSVWIESVSVVAPGAAEESFDLPVMHEPRIDDQARRSQPVSRGVGAPVVFALMFLIDMHGRDPRTGGHGCPRQSVCRPRLPVRGTRHCRSPRKVYGRTARHYAALVGKSARDIDQRRPWIDQFLPTWNAPRPVKFLIASVVWPILGLVP